MMMMMTTLQTTATECFTSKPHPSAVVANTANTEAQQRLHTVNCTLQARIGGLDRVLGAITHRGWLPVTFESSFNKATQTLNVTFSFESTDLFSVQKLVKFLEKQVYVLSATLVTENSAHFNTPSPFLSPVKQHAV